MKESTSVWLRMRLEQQRGPSLSKFRVWNMRNYHTLKKNVFIELYTDPPRKWLLCFAPLSTKTVAVFSS